MTLKLGARRRGLIVPLVVLFFLGCAEHVRSRPITDDKKMVVVYTTSTSDTSDVGVVAQREVDQCLCSFEEK